MLAAAVVRTLPELGIGTMLLGAHYAIGALLWAASFGVWLYAFLPYFLAPALASPNGNEGGGCLAVTTAEQPG
ncbi:hypothetical protein D3C86_2181000 [compost metagenome]